MSLTLKEQARRRTRWLMVCAIGVVALVAVVVISLISAGGSGEDNANKPGTGESSTGASPAPSTLAPDDDEEYADPDTWVRLPKGEDTRNGLPVKFPHSSAGAAGMAAAAARNAWSFDAEQIERGAETYTVERYREAMAGQAEAGADAAARFAGVPSGRTPPKDAQVSGVPIGVQWQAKGRDRVVVHVLSRVTTSAGDGAETKTRLQAVPTEAVWEQGDWKTTPTPKGDTPEAPDPAELGTKKFSALGWKAIQEGDRR